MKSIGAYSFYRSCYSRCYANCALLPSFMESFSTLTYNQSPIRHDSYSFFRNRAHITGTVLQCSTQVPPINISPVNSVKHPRRDRKVNRNLHTETQFSLMKYVLFVVVKIFNVVKSLWQKGRKNLKYTQQSLEKKGLFIGVYVIFTVCEYKSIIWLGNKFFWWLVGLQLAWQEKDQKRQTAL